MDIENLSKKLSSNLLNQPKFPSKQQFQKQIPRKLSKLNFNITHKNIPKITSERNSKHKNKNKLNNKYAPTQTPPTYQNSYSNQISFISNSNVENDGKNLTHLGFLSPRGNLNMTNITRDKMLTGGFYTTDNSFAIERKSVKDISQIFKQKQKCGNCQKLSCLLWQQKYEKDISQNKYKESLKKYEEILKQKTELQQKISKIEQKLSKTQTTLQPYKNSVNIMQQHLNSIKQSLKIPQIQQNNEPTKINIQLTQQNRTLNFQLYLLQKSHNLQIQSTNSKINRLNILLTHLQLKNKQLQQQLTEIKHQNIILNGIIHDGSYVNQLKQLFNMSCQQTYQLKIIYKQCKQQKQKLLNLVQKLRSKISLLTSLIGYGVVSNIQNNDLHQIRKIANNINNINNINKSYINQRLTLDIYGLQSIKNYKESYAQIKQSCNQQQSSNCLYQANFLIMYEDQQIKNTLQQNITTIIKPQFFLLIRAILDAKFYQFIIDKQKCNKFCDFAYTFIEYFRIKKNTKRIQINSKRNCQQKDYMKTNFLLRIFDRKIGHLPQMLTFRQFLIKNSPQDEIFYYLMCRNLIYDGPQLDNYVNCSDTYNFVSYQRVLQRLQAILQNLDKNCRNVIYNHLNSKKVMKNKRLLIKGNYVIRLLLQVYRKIKKQKIQKLRIVFEQTCKFTRSDYLKYIHFKQLLRKNFTFLTNSDITQHYRKSISIFHTHNQATFFQAFNASCMEKIFLQQNLILLEELKLKIFDHTNFQRCNYLLELIPDSIAQFGNQSIYQQYISYIKLKSLNFQNRIKISIFLMKIIHIRMFDIQKKEKQRQFLMSTVDELNNKLIDFINQNFQRRQKYEESLQKASSFIGKQAKKKIYQFYSEFVKDIKQQTSKEI